MSLRSPLKMDVPSQPELEISHHYGQRGARHVVFEKISSTHYAELVPYRSGDHGQRASQDAVPALAMNASIKSGIVLGILFPLIALALVAATLEYSKGLGIFVSITLFFPAPFYLILTETFSLRLDPSWGLGIALWMHYPVLGFAVGYFSPFEVSPSRKCLKQIGWRYGLFILALLGIEAALLVLVAIGPAGS